ncbi:MAG: alkaline phosphatase family protein [Actinomycetota bacterium]|nr:alkaline phosphatase family protein [Actinomycetota bacterium]
MRLRPQLISLIASLATGWALVAAPATGMTAPANGMLAQTQATRAQLAATACELPTKLLVRSWRGQRADRSGDIDIIPQEPDFVGTGGLPHSGPWDYVGQVPLWLYGPGYIQARGSVDRVVTLADIAPTQGKLVDFPFDAPDGAPLAEALVPEAERPDPPKLVVVVVWDGGGTFVLDEWSKAWPNLEGLIDEGTWYDKAEVGSSPPSTAQIHATIGTGAFSRDHGLVAHQLRIGDRLTDPWEAGPRYLVAPTFADLYDRAMGNRPLVGTLATVAIHLGMMSHGSLWGGGDQDIAVLREREGAATLGAEGISWNLTSNVAPYYRMLPYVNDLPPITDYFDEIDLQDGRDDGQWHELALDGERAEEALKTPARIPWQTRLIDEVVQREGFGADDVPDLLYVNYKLIDEIGHLYSMNAVEMRDSIATQDADLPKLIDLLNERVGEGEWVMMLTADHGHTPDPAVSGAAVISPTSVANAIQDRFDTDGDDTRIVEFTQPTHIFIDHGEMEQNGTTLEEISSFLLTVTKGDVQGGQYPVSAAVADERAFIAAFPSEMLDDLPCLQGKLPDHGSKDSAP